MAEVTVVIVGAGQSGLATAACLSRHSIPWIILEKDDCIAPLWRKRTYDRLHIHLPKNSCQLPHLPHDSATPTYMSKDGFVKYLDDYAEKFDLRPVYCHEVESAFFHEETRRWHMAVRNLNSGESLDYISKYLVIASGENDAAFMPEIPGLENFRGDVLHSSQYRSGSKFEDKNVLVVGSGNSGMEIALDLCNSRAKPSITIRSPMHVVSRGIWRFGMFLMSYLPLGVVDAAVLFLCNLKFGDTSKLGIRRPREGPFYLKLNSPVYPVVDVGTLEKIKSGEIQVYPSLKEVIGNSVVFANEKMHPFDGIIFATGYKSMVKNWLKDDDYLIGDDGMCKQKHPNHWKGRNGLYCAGLVWRGIYGSADDAENIANDINDDLKC